MLKKLSAALKGVAGTPDVSPEAVDCIVAICREATERGDSWMERIRLSGLASWETLKTSDETLQTEVALHCALNKEPLTGRPEEDHWLEKEVRSAIASQLLRKNLPYSDVQLATLIFKAAKQSYLDYGLPIASILGATERFCQGSAPKGQLKIALKFLKGRIDFLSAPFGITKTNKKFRDRVEAILEPGQQDAAPTMPNGLWGRSQGPWLEKLAKDERDAWNSLLVFAATAGDKSKPTRKWLNDAAQLVSAVGDAGVTAQLSKWLASTTPDPAEVDTSLDVLKGLIWASVHLDHDAMAPAVGRFAEVCFRKVPEIGARSVKLGNASIVALATMKGSDAAIAELVRLKTRIKYASVRGTVNKRIAELAEDAGVSVADLEESALPDFGFGPDGRQEIALGEASAIISLDDTAPVLNWRGADDKPRKAPPAAVKRDFADELKAIKQQVKDIDIAWGVQIARLEASWVEDRSWSTEIWRMRFLDHPLRRQISKHLIWRFETGGRAIDAMPGDDGLTDLNGDTATPPTDATVRLWHPLDAEPEDVLAWRRRIMNAGVTQPIKQAHREVYVLTDAERATEIYSNRFAAHILRQHQFRALCHARGWTYDFQGSWDSFNIPARQIPERKLTALYHVEAIENDAMSDAWIPLHLASDQVRFTNEDGEAVRLEDMEPILFSELMRDVDLFVAVTSVANDPDWVDGGPDGQHGTYWSEYAFGDLSQTAHTRRELIAEIVPKLAIADKLTVSDKYLEVRGKRHDYRIHLGSSNIQIMPGNRYLCIVRGRTPKDKQSVKLPFTGDSLLSIILSKAFMLANDDKITDETILTQLGR